jgi:hypothetical protein
MFMIAAEIVCTVIRQPRRLALLALGFAEALEIQSNPIHAGGVGLPGQQRVVGNQRETERVAEPRHSRARQRMSGMSVVGAGSRQLSGFW